MDVNVVMYLNDEYVGEIVVEVLSEDQIEDLNKVDYSSVKNEYDLSCVLLNNDYSVYPRSCNVDCSKTVVIRR